MAQPDRYGSILVTGASGLVGTAVVRHLAGRQVRLRLLARRSWRPPTSVHDAEILLGDVSDPAVIARAIEGMQAVIHLAGHTSSADADADPLGAWWVNVAPLVQLLEASRTQGSLRTVLLAGSESQAGNASHLPLDERAPDCPGSTYDLHKLQAEQVLELYVRRGLAHGTCLRLPTVYGPGPHRATNSRGMVRAAVTKALAGQDLTVYGAGTWRRDYLHVNDAAAAFLAAMDQLPAVDGRHFLVGTGEGITVAEAVNRIAEEVARQSGRPRVGVGYSSPPTGWSAVDERDIVIDASAFADATGWSPAFTFDDGLADLVTSMRAEDSEAL
ncbi:MAG: NAD-dependent epimerase/dehydratase family protein [Actinobacteria bacterium]|nr:NAD-dependent epimerase/dehydratase family protein [Actinomycetota bacterium]